MNVTSETVPVEWIQVGERIRKEFGDLRELAESITEVGLIQSIAVDEDYRLLAGERRLRALMQSGATEVDVRRFHGLHPYQKERIELDENRRRKPFTTYEEARYLLQKGEIAKELYRQMREEQTQQIEAAQASLMRERQQLDADWIAFERERAQQAESNEVGDNFCNKLQKTDGRGRPEQGDSEIARALGVARPVIQRARQQVAAGEKYSFLQRPGWDQASAIDVGRRLDAIAEDALSILMPLLGAPDNTPKRVKQCLTRWEEADSELRDRILGALSSNDEGRISQAETYLLDLPPEPDPRRAWLKRARLDIDNCIRYSEDDLQQRFVALDREMEALYAAVKAREEASYEFPAARHS